MHAWDAPERTKQFLLRLRIGCAQAKPVVIWHPEALDTLQEHFEIAKHASQLSLPAVLGCVEVPLPTCALFVGHHKANISQLCRRVMVCGDLDTWLALSSSHLEANGDLCFALALCDSLGGAAQGRWRLRWCSNFGGWGGLSWLRSVLCLRATQQLGIL